MNIRKLKSLLWLAACLALLLAGWTFWDIYQGKTQELRYQSRPSTYFSEVLNRDIEADRSFNAGPTSYAVADYEQIWKARIDGSVEPVAKKPGTGQDGSNKPKEVQLEKLDEIVAVGMVLWHEDPIYRLIALEYVKDDSSFGLESSGKRRRLHLTEGELLKAPYDEAPYFGKVLRIGHQDVAFQWGAEEVTLTPGLDSSGDGLPIDQITFAAAVDLNSEFDEWPADSIQRIDGSWVFGENDLREFADGGDQLQSQVRARSITPSGGGRTSIELTDVEEGSMPARFGFKTGDRIISVNGHPMSSVAEGINWGKNHPEEPQYIVLWERLGVEETTVIHNKNKDK
ncbi:MAG: PDZ domain-containing protein [Planctomycetota bacterium]|jgi:hypothetical protein|nr:PDZ domain-containing protein [Planctomycetota bacterium]